MKIALVSFYLMETTIPLAKHLLTNDVEVDLYSLLPYNNQNTFVYNFLDNNQAVGFVDEKIMKKTFGKKLCDYLFNINTKVFIWPDRRFQQFLLIDFYYAYKLAHRLKNGKYDLIHIIHTSPRFWFFLYLFIEKRKVVQTLHEVTDHEAKTSASTTRILKSLTKNSTPIIFHSDISRQRFIDFRTSFSGKETSEENLTMIRFGLFETYHCFSNNSINIKKNGKINILNLGRIVPSKGINFLIEAIKILQERYPIHLTIAGSGEPYFDFEGIISYDFINRFISNEEIVNLIEGCNMVVLPYISASQSGVPMTVYAFNKPIIATNIGGFKEVIENFKTGILVDNLNAQSLASSIEILLKKPSLMNEMSKNIEQKYMEGEFSWPFIANKTINFYKKRLTILKLINYKSSKKNN